MSSALDVVGGQNISDIESKTSRRKRSAWMGLIEARELKPGIKECRTLAELRHTSLPRLIGGEIRANEATGTSQVFVT